MRTSRRALVVAIILGVGACTAGSGGVPLDGGVAGDDGGANGDGRVQPGEGGGVEGGGGGCTGTGPAVTFTMHASTAGYCLGPGSCNVTWLTILLPNGTAAVLDNLCATDCATCQGRPCPGSCQASSPVPRDGQSTTWNGNYYTQSSCGNAPSCLAPQCAAPGRYTARFCAYKSDTDGGMPCLSGGTPPPPSCTDVPFDWPAGAGVNGTVP
jgi:hypothetical protein